MKQILFLIMALVAACLPVKSAAEIIFQDTTGIRDYTISMATEPKRISDNPDALKYMTKILNNTLDKALPILHRKIVMYNELASEYQSLKNDDKLEFLKQNKIKIDEMGFVELTTIDMGNKALDPSKEEAYSKAMQYKTIAEVCEYAQKTMLDDLDAYLYKVKIKLISPTWGDFIKELMKYGYNKDEAIKIANESNYFEDIDGNVKIYKPKSSQKKNKTTKKSKRK